MFYKYSTLKSVCMYQNSIFIILINSTHPKYFNDYKNFEIGQADKKLWILEICPLLLKTCEEFKYEIICPCFYKM